VIGKHCLLFVSPHVGKAEGESSMLSAASFVSISAGAAIARLSGLFPASTETLETIAGTLLIAGFAAIGCSLPVML
jgi:hypothetical protein